MFENKGRIRIVILLLAADIACGAILGLLNAVGPSNADQYLHPLPEMGRVVFVIASFCIGAFATIMITVILLINSTSINQSIKLLVAADIAFGAIQGLLSALGPSTSGQYSDTLPEIARSFIVVFIITTFCMGASEMLVTALALFIDHKINGRKNAA